MQSAGDMKNQQEFKLNFAEGAEVTEVQGRGDADDGGIGCGR
jgi:hypothetical protein